MSTAEKSPRHKADYNTRLPDSHDMDALMTCAAPEASKAYVVHGNDRAMTHVKVDGGGDVIVKPLIVRSGAATILKAPADWHFSLKWLCYDAP